jgi:YVTN family beta-propeller protein
MGTIGVGSNPKSFILDPEARKFYVVNRGAGNVTVIDKTTRKEERVIPVGKNPYGITMFPN